ncbi:hypothetical protein GQX74_004861 [Glossina fuscipes]|nr:hypothetical protein GQX74_004861 [Glossina fuscipes]
MYTKLLQTFAEQNRKLQSHNSNFNKQADSYIYNLLTKQFYSTDRRKAWFMFASNLDYRRHARRHARRHIALSVSVLDKSFSLIGSNLEQRALADFVRSITDCKYSSDSRQVLRKLTAYLNTVKQWLHIFCEGYIFYQRALENKKNVSDMQQIFAVLLFWTLAMALTAFAKKDNEEEIVIKFCQVSAEIMDMLLTCSHMQFMCTALLEYSTCEP